MKSNDSMANLRAPAPVPTTTTTTATVKIDESKQIQENLTKWDDLCPLDDDQIRSIQSLNQYNKYNHTADDLDDFNSYNNIINNELANQNANTSDKSSKTHATSDDTTPNIDQINEDINELLYNFDINDIEDNKLKNYIEILNSYKTKCDDVYESINGSLKFLQTLQDNYSHVSEKTNSLHNACEQILSDQTKLINTSDLIGSKLSYFTEIDVLIQKLNSPLIENNFEYIIPTLSRIDECMAFLEQNKSYKDSETYLAILRQALNKALTLIKSQMVNNLNAITNSIIQQLQDTNEQLHTLSADSAYTLFYSKFRSNSHRIKTLMEQLEQRCDNNSLTDSSSTSSFDISAQQSSSSSSSSTSHQTRVNQIDYEQALNECHKYYVQQRRMLLTQSINNAINDLKLKYQRDTCTLIRSSCSFMIHLCQDEFKLFSQFFSKNSLLLNKLLEEFCTRLYDELRPIIIHVVHIETLSELCSILKNEILMDNVKNNVKQLEPFEIVCSQMLEDVQERLVYRTHIYIKEQIRDYNPSNGDIAYPEKLEIMEKIAAQLQNANNNSNNSVNDKANVTTTSSQETNLVISNENSGNDTVKPENIATTIATSQLSEPNTPTIGKQDKSLFELNTLFKENHVSPADVHGMWFPTVRRTLICLSKLYRCLEKPIFEGLSQETLSMCVESLIKASDKITKNKSHVDGELFLVKHLLILREQIAPFNVEFSVKEMQLDFTKIKDAAINLIYKRDKYFKFDKDNAFLDFLLNGTLQVKENYIDSKREVDNHLKKSCEQFIMNTTNDLISNIKSWLDKTQTILKMNKESNTKVSLKQQPFAKADKLHDVIAENYKDIRKKLPRICHLMAIYLANKDIEYIIFKRIKNNIQHAYQEIQQIVNSEYNDEEKLIIACPTLEQISLLTAVTISK